MKNLTLPIIAVFISQAVRGEVFDHTQAVNLLLQQKPTSVEHYLSLLPEDFRFNHVLIHQTRSQDQASVTAPRIVLFNGDGSLLMAISGQPDHSRGQFVEMIRYDKALHRFIPTEIEFRDQKFEITENPTSCAQCHGSPVRPIWDGYNIWPGMFGATHNFAIWPTWNERLKYLFFKGSQLPQRFDRYSALVDRPKAVSILGARNNSLTTIIAQNNADRVTHMILQHMSNQTEFLPALLAALVDQPESFLKLLPGPISSDEIVKTRKEMTWTLNRDHYRQAARLRKASGIRRSELNFPLQRLDIVTMLNLLEVRGAIPPLASWSTAFYGEFLNFGVGYGDFFRDVAYLLFNQAPDQKMLKQNMEAGDLGLLFEAFTKLEPSMKVDKVGFASRHDLDMKIHFNIDCQTLLYK